MKNAPMGFCRGVFISIFPNLNKKRNPPFQGGPCNFGYINESDFNKKLEGVFK